MPDSPKNVPHPSPSRTLDYLARKTRWLRPVIPKATDAPTVSWQYHLAFILLSGLAILLAYSNSFGPGNDRKGELNWTLDNKYIIELDPRTKASTWQPAASAQPVNVPNGIRDIWMRDYWWPKGISGLYRPIVSLTYWFNWHVQSGDETKIDPNLGQATRDDLTDQIVRDRLRIFHRWNLFSHWITTVLVYFTALLLTKRFWTAGAIGILFGLHPVAVESVTNIIGRADIFAAINVFGGLLLYVRAMRAYGIRKAPWLIGLGLLTFVGVFSKESAVAVIAVCALYDAIYRVPWKQLFKFPTSIQIDSAWLALRIGLAVVISFTWWQATIKGMLPAIDAWVPAATTVIPTPNVPASYVWMLIFAGASFLALLAALTMIPWGRQRYWWMIPALVPTIYMVTLLWIGLPDAKKLIGVFMLAMAALAASELLFQKSSDDLQPLPDEAEVPGNPWRWFADHYLTFIPVLIALYCVRSAVFDATTPPETPFLDNPIRGVNWYAGRITALHVMAKLWWLLLWPVRLCCDYSFNQVPTFSRFSSTSNDVISLLCALLVLAVFIYAIVLWKRNRAASFFMMFFFLAFLPTSNILLTIGSIMAERFMYLPLIGFVGCLVLVIEWMVKRGHKMIASRAKVPRWLSSQAIVVAIVAIIGTLYGVRTFKRNYDWRSDFTLWDSGIKVSPHSFRSYQSYAFAIYEEVCLPKEQRQPETQESTIDDCIRVIELGRPIVDQLPDRINSSRLYLHQGMYWSWKADHAMSGVTNPTPAINEQIAGYLLNAAGALEKGAAVDRAFDELNRQKEYERGKRDDEIFDSGLPQIYDFLGTVYARLGRFNDAIDAFAYSRQLSPLDATTYIKIATMYSQSGRHEQAAASLIQALWLEPRRTQIWNPLAQELGLVNPDSAPAVVMENGQPRLNTRLQIVQSTHCSAYQGLLRVMLETKQIGLADVIYRAAVFQTGYPQSLFDDIYKDFHRAPPTRPAPTTAPGAPTAAPVFH